MRHLLVLAGCCIALAGCGNDDKRAADEARYRAEQRALVELATMQSLLAKSEQSFEAGDPRAAVASLGAAYDDHYALVRDPLHDADADLEASLDQDIDVRLREVLDGAAPADEVKRLFAQIQTDLTTAADAIRS